MLLSIESMVKPIESLDSVIFGGRIFECNKLMGMDEDIQSCQTIVSTFGQAVGATVFAVHRHGRTIYSRIHPFSL